MKINSLLLLFILIVTGLTGCSKNGDDVLAPQLSTSLNIINATVDTVNFYQNGTRLNNGSNLLPGGQYLGIDVLVGAQNFQFKKAGTPNVLVNAPLTVQKLTNYTMFIAGESTDKVFLLKDVLVTDTLPNVTRIRFVNAAPDAGNLDFTIASIPTFKTMAFKSATAFLAVPSGKVSYSIYRQGIATPLAAGTLTVTQHYSYTLFAKGVVNGTGANALGARIVVTSSN